MADPPRRLRRRWLSLLVACVAVVVLLAACSEGGEPTSYDDTVEENFTRGCEVAAASDPAISPVAQKYCDCAYGRLVAEISFEDFKSLDDDVEEDPEKIRSDDDDEGSAAARLTAIFEDCRTTHGRG